MALTTTGGDASSFRQQGTMDWVALAQKPVQFSFNVLARYSKAGIDPLTVAAGQAACTSLQIPWKTQQEILERMSTLPCLALYGNMAWFGFGLKHALFDLTDRDGGLECLTLCGCLAESFTTFYGAQVLHAFCRHQNMFSALLPGIRNWHALLKPCAGFFAGSKFPTLIHGFACLLIPHSSSGMRSYEATAPEALAQALIWLIQVSSKRLKNITITGGIDCAWLAAFAEFVLGLRIEILTCDGAQEYCSSDNNSSLDKRIQVTFLKDGAAKQEIEIARKLFILPAGKELFQKETDPVAEDQLNLVRSSWTSILIDSFGKSAQFLLYAPEISSYFGKILVYAAQEDAKIQSTSPLGNWTSVYLKMQYYADSRHGDDLLDFAAWRLPELKSIIKNATVNREHRIDFGMATEAVRGVEVACCCSICKNYDIQDWRWPCLLRVVGTVVEMISILSVTNTLELKPIVFGVRRLYDNIYDYHVLDRIHTLRKKSHENLLLRAHKLFSRSAIMKHWKPHAVAEGGICSFLGLLTDPKLPPNLAGTVTVMPGHIEYAGALFEGIDDLPFRSDHSVAEPVPFDLESRKTFDLLLSETADSITLQAGYRSQDNSPGTPSHFTVGEIIGGLVESEELSEDYYLGLVPSRAMVDIDHKENCANQRDYMWDMNWFPQNLKFCVMIAFLMLIPQCS